MGKPAEPVTELLACDCQQCVHWEIVRIDGNSIHLHCKTCEKRIELDSFTAHEDPNLQLSWVLGPE